MRTFWVVGKTRVVYFTTFTLFINESFTKSGKGTVI